MHGRPSDDLAEHTQAAPAGEPIMDRLVLSVCSRRIAPEQAVSDQEDDPADGQAIIDTRNAVRQGKNTALFGASAPPTARTDNPAQPILVLTVNQQNLVNAGYLTGPESRIQRLSFLFPTDGTIVLASGLSTRPQGFLGMNETIPSNPELASSLYEEVFMPAVSQAIKTLPEDKGALIIDAINANAYTCFLYESIGAGLMRRHADRLEKAAKFVS
jgi:hypothetical protein